MKNIRLFITDFITDFNIRLFFTDFNMTQGQKLEKVKADRHYSIISQASQNDYPIHFSLSQKIHIYSYYSHDATISLRYPKCTFLCVCVYLGLDGNDNIFFNCIP